jgi:hypothetical protein
LVDSLNKGFMICPEGTGMTLKEFATSVTASLNSLVPFGILKNAGLFRDILGIDLFIGLLDSIMNSAMFTGLLYDLRVCLVRGLGLGIILFTVIGGGSGGGSTRTLAPLGLRGGGFLLGTWTAAAVAARSAARAAARAFTSKGFGLAIFGTTGWTGSTCWTGSVGTTGLELDLDLFFFLDLSFSGAIFFGSL